MDEPLVRYELWDQGASLCFFPEGDESFRRLLEPGAKLVWSCVAASWSEAQSMKHEYLGWEPYVPL